MEGLTWSGGEVIDEGGEEGSGLQVIVVLLSKLLRGSQKFETDQLESLLLESSNDIGDLLLLVALSGIYRMSKSAALPLLYRDPFTHQTTVDTVGLDSDESSLFVGAWGS